MKIQILRSKSIWDLGFKGLRRTSSASQSVTPTTAGKRQDVLTSFKFKCRRSHYDTDNCRKKARCLDIKGRRSSMRVPGLQHRTEWRTFCFLTPTSSVATFCRRNPGAHNPTVLGPRQKTSPCWHHVFMPKILRKTPSPLVNNPRTTWCQQQTDQSSKQKTASK
jgi:hypothetical protein